jgi:hypothetical protein
MPNELILTAGQSLESPPPARLTLATVQVSAYQQIRVVTSCRDYAEGPVEVVLTHVEGGNDVAPLDRYVLVPGAQANEVYPVPGVLLRVEAGPTDGTSSEVDVRIWGFRSGDGYPAIRPAVPPLTLGTLTVNVFLDAGDGTAGANAGAGVQVRLDGLVMGDTDDGGTLTFQRTEADYTVEVLGPEGETGSTDVTIFGGSSTTADVVMSPLRDGTGRGPKKRKPTGRDGNPSS